LVKTAVFPLAAPANIHITHHHCPFTTMPFHPAIFPRIPGISEKSGNIQSDQTKFLFA
jgi:hypothetical protein